MTKRNQNRSGYKETKVGWIPEEWEVKRIQDISEINPESLRENTPSDYQFYYIDLSSVKDGKIDIPCDKITFKEAPSRARRRIKKNDVLLATVRPNLKGFGVIDFTSDEYVCSTGFAVLRPCQTRVSRYIYYNLFSHQAARYFYGCVVGSNYPALNNSDVEHLKIPLPPLPEQKKIAEILSAWDRAIEQTRKLIDARKRLKKGLMQQLLTGRMRFPEFGAPVAQKGELPDGWERVQLHETCDFIYGKDWKSVAVNSSQIPVYGTGGIIGYSSSPIHNGTSILIGRKGTIDNPLFIEGKFWAVDTTFYTTIKDSVIPRYLYYLFTTVKWRKYNEASGVPSLSRNTIQNIRVTVPTINEQKKVADIISIIDTEIELYMQNVKMLSEQKKGLMQKLLTGEIRVNPAN